MRIERLIQSSQQEIRFDLQTGHLNGLLIYTKTNVMENALNAQLTVKLRGTKTETPVNAMDIRHFNAIADLENGSFNAAREMFHVIAQAAADPTDLQSDDALFIANQYISYVPLGSIFPKPDAELDVYLKNSLGADIVICGVSVAKDFPVVHEYDVIEDNNNNFLQVNRLYAFRANNNINPMFSIKYAGSDLNAAFDDMNIGTQIFSRSEQHNPLVAVIYSTQDDLPEDVTVKHDQTDEDVTYITMRTKPFEKQFYEAQRDVEAEVVTKLNRVKRVNPDYVKAKQMAGSKTISRISR